VLAVACGLSLFAYFRYIRMPGVSHTGPLPLGTDEDERIAQQLREDVTHLAGAIGERHMGRLPALREAAEFIHSAWQAMGYTVERQTYTVFEVACDNLYVEVAGAKQPDEIIVIGAHYDSVPGSPGANDNASGVAALLALSRAFAPSGRLHSEADANRITDHPPFRPGRTLRFVAFVNEEAPYGLTPAMGSYHFARMCRERNERIVGMMSLETLGYYHDEPRSQLHPFPLGLLYPSTGDFVAFVGNDASGHWVRACVAAFRERAAFPSEGGALPGFMRDAARSDQWSFWRHGYPGLMVTDTANFRYPYYHTSRDTSEKLNYGRLARVVRGIEETLRSVAGG
jgi:hypothetical protein